jgi:hypothetical protein
MRKQLFIVGVASAVLLLGASALASVTDMAAPVIPVSTGAAFTQMSTT